MAISRRSFMKYAAATVGGTVLADSTFIGAKAKEKASKENARYVPTLCDMCFWGCGAVAKVVDGKVVKLDGNPLHPNSRGKLCGRGQGGIGLLYDEDRIKTPLIRDGARGEGKFKTASWDAALDYTAERLLAIKEKYGPESLASFLHGYAGGFFFNMSFAFGSPNVSYPSFAQCMGPRNEAYVMTYGENPESSCERVDLANSRVIVLTGTHLGENMHNSQVQDYCEAIGNGAKIIVVDPRFSTAASKAHIWLPIKPGTDTALYLAWMNIIISEGWYDKEYVEKYTHGFEELAHEVKQYSPSWAAKITELPEEKIVEVARELGRYAPHVLVHPGRHSVWYGNDVQRCRANAILNAILGTWGREGGIWLAPKAQLPDLDDGKPEYVESEEDPITFGEYPFAGGEGVCNEVIRVTMTGDPYPIKAWLIAGTNLIKAIPRPEDTLKAINNLDLLVSIEIMPVDTAMLADVILPECTYLEKQNLAVVKTKSVGVAIRQPVVQPMYESKPSWWIAKQLCNRLGVGEYVPYDDFGEVMKKQVAAWGLDYEELCDKGYIPIPNTYTPYITDDNQPVFKTHSGKIDLFCEELEEEDFDPIPKYTAVEGPSPGYYRLLYGRSPVQTFSRTVNNEWLWELYKENNVWVNATEAAKSGIKNGDYVVLINQDGVQSARVRARVTEKIRPDCVFVVHGYGQHSKRLSRAHDKGIDDGALMTRYNIDPIIGSTGMRVNFVKIMKEA
jgi:thiosulfate reductase/polysulfide reductase chain A